MERLIGEDVRWGCGEGNSRLDGFIQLHKVACLAFMRIKRELNNFY